jgi:hypothetical protein
MKKLEKEQAQKELDNLLSEMDVPETRYTDYFWLLRNLAVRNSEHANFMKVIRLIKQLSSNKEYINF